MNALAASFRYRFHSTCSSIKRGPSIIGAVDLPPEPESEAKGGETV
jgi:hypothetical protein